MKGKQLISISRTFELQFGQIKDRHFPLKFLGMCCFLLCIFLPWYLSDKFWWFIEDNCREPVRDTFKITYIYSTVLIFSLYGVYGLFYWLEHPAIERYKDNQVPWPWISDPEWKKKLKKSVLLLFINRGIVTGTLGYLGIRSGAAKFRVHYSDLPSFPVFFGQVIFLMLVEDFAFYWAHRLLHQKWIYPYVHKLHHEYYNSIVISSGYTHPIEYLLSSFLPSALGSALLMGRTHLLAMLVFLTFRLVESCEAHSGYDFPFSLTKYLPFSCSPSYHNHHHLVNIGNYGSFFIIWDTIFGTNSHFFEEIQDKNGKYKSK